MDKRKVNFIINNTLITKNPSLAKEWHPARNGSLTPGDVAAKTGKKVWWICSKGHEWEAIVSNRSNGAGCPHCYKQSRKTISMVLSVVRDIPERKQAEKTLERKSEEQELLLDNIQTLIWYLTDSETHGIVNKACADFFGKKKEDLENKKVHDIMPKKEAEICIAGNKEVFEKKVIIHTEECVKNAKGGKRLLAITKTPKIRENGNVEYVVCSAEDITERKKAEEEIRLKMSEIERLNKLFLGREHRLIELKKEVNALLEKMGQPKKYDW